MTSQASADQLEDPVAEDDVLGLGGGAGIHVDGVAEQPHEERRDRDRVPRDAGVGRLLEGPQAVGDDRGAGRGAPDEPQVGVGVADQAAPGAGLAAERVQLGVALAGHDEQRAEAGHQQEPLREREVGRDAAGHRPHQEPGRHDRDVEHRLVLEPDGVEQLQAEVGGHEHRELRVGQPAHARPRPPRAPRRRPARSGPAARRTRSAAAAWSGAAGRPRGRRCR